MTSHSLITFILGFLPLSEIRGAVLYGLASGLSPWETYLWGFLGNILPVLPFLYFLEYLSGWLSRHFYYFNRLFAWLFAKTRNHRTHFIKWGWIFGLPLFVAIPLPLTGAWSATLVVFLFGFPRLPSFLLICLGIALAGLISLGVVSTVFSFASLIFR